MWVAGEVARCKQGARGHVYFELIEKGEHDSIVGKLDAVIWNADFQRVKRMLAATGQRLADGVQIRCRGNLDFYGAAGRLQLTIREVDPAFTLGLLELRRRETLAALEAAGLMARNRALALPELPLALALVTSEGSAAYHDFLSGLRESGYGFRVLFVHAAVQGRDSEREVVSALRTLAALQATTARTATTAINAMRIDCAVLIRGGGSKTDLAAFDSRAIAEAIALAPFPVLTGLGHEIDRSIADLVAHTALKTPTKVAEFLVGRVARLDDAVEELRRALRRDALAPLARAREALGRAERGVSLARLRLAGAGAHVEEHARTLARLGRSALRAALLRGDLCNGTRERLHHIAIVKEIAHDLIHHTQARKLAQQRTHLLFRLPRLTREIPHPRRIETSLREQRHETRGERFVVGVERHRVRQEMQPRPAACHATLALERFNRSAPHRIAHKRCRHPAQTRRVRPLLIGRARMKFGERFDNALREPRPVRVCDHRAFVVASLRCD